MKNFDAFKEHGDVIWNIANLLRGPYRPPQYRRVMIPLTVLRRLDCVLEETKEKVIAEYKKIIDVYRAASNFMIDDVIDPRETRPVVIKALEMAANKKVDRPWKKQGVVPV